MELLQERNFRIAFGQSGKQIGCKVLQQIGYTNSGDHDRHTRCTAQRLISYAFDQNAQNNRGNNHQHNRNIPGKKEVCHGENHEVCSHHEDITVGKVDQTKDTVYHRITDSDQGINTADGDPGQAILPKCGQTHKRTPKYTAEAAF